MYAIEARGLTKSFRHTPAVSGVDLLVDEGDVVALLGPNGAGKTTTLMMLLGITEPDAGEVRLLGHSLPAERVAAMEQTSFAASYLDLPERLTVKQILEVFAQIYGAPRRRVAEVVELFGLGQFMKRSKSQLSSGQKTLIGLARSLLHRPRLLILDEPTASLDPEQRSRLWDDVLSLPARGGAVCFVTQHEDELHRADRVLELRDGRLV